MTNSLYGFRTATQPHFLSILAKPENIKSMPTKATNKLLVKNVPPSSDKEHLQMFFEYERGQGGGRVRQVKINDDRSAIIEFEEAKSVGVVLRKAPIKMLGETVEVKAFVPYLDYGETLDSINLKGFPAELIEEIATLNLKSEKSLNRELKVGDRVRVKRSVKTPFYEWGSLDITHESVGIIHSFGVIDGKNQMLVNFPTFQNWSADPDEMELVN